MNKSFPTRALVSIAIGASPVAMVAIQFTTSGGLDWPMVWGNEATVWSVLLSPFVVVGMLGLISTSNGSRSSIVVATIGCLASVAALCWTFDAVLSSGFAPWSKGDTEELELFYFWSSGWWR